MQASRCWKKISPFSWEPRIAGFSGFSAWAQMCIRDRCTDGLAAHAAALGAGKFITSITMTIF